MILRCKLLTPGAVRCRLRLSVYLFVVFGVLALSSGRALYAHGRDAALALGSELSGLGELTGGAAELLVNGQRFHHSLVVLDAEPHAILDQVQAECERNPALFGQALAAMAARGGQALDEAGVPQSARHGVVREESAGRAMLVCFVDDERSGLAELEGRLVRFAATGDAASFGSVRYVYAERTNQHQSRVLTLWTDGGLDLAAMFPAEGDAAGGDSLHVPRPPSSQRVLAVAAAGMPFLLLQYVSSQPRAGLRAFYADWSRDHRFAEVAHQSDEGAAYLAGDGSQVFITLLDLGRGTQVTVVEVAGAIAGAEVEE